MDSDEQWQWTTGGLISHAEGAFPEHVALLAPGRHPLSYAQLGALCQSLRAQMREHGFAPEARIAVALSGEAEMTAAFLATSSCAACMPFFSACPEAEAAQLLTRACADGLMIERGTDTGLRAAASNLGLPVIEVTVDLSDSACEFAWDMPVIGPSLPPQPPDREATALLLLTSGTTGASKLVSLTHGNICSSAMQMAGALRLQPDDRCLNVMPSVRMAGLGDVILASVAAGATVICADSFQPTQFLDLMERFAPTWYTASPAMHRAILDAALGTRRVVCARPLRFIRTSAAPCPGALADQLEQYFGVPVVDHYGVTETGPFVSGNPLPPGVRKRGSVGVPASCEVAIMGADGTHLAVGAVGQVVVRGPNVMRQDENSDSAGGCSVFVDSWFCTGDMGYLDADGYLFLTGRLKELINHGDDKIPPGEVEDALLTHHAVYQAAAFGVPDPTLGEEVCAAVVLTEGSHTTASELRSFAAQLLSASKVPGRIFVVKELPMSALGKVLRRRLVEMVTDLDGSASPRVDDGGQQDDRMKNLQELLLVIWRDVLGVTQVSLDDDFLDMGGDSLGATRFIARVCAVLGCSLSYRELFEHSTVRCLAELLVERVSVSSDPPATA